MFYLNLKMPVKLGVLVGIEKSSTISLLFLLLTLFHLFSDLTHTFRSMSLNNEEEAIKASKKPTPSRPPPTTPGLTRVIAMTYPPTIDSNEWTTVDLPPGPRSHAKNSSKSSNMYRK